MALMNYKSDNTNYPDPKNLWEFLLLKWHNLFDKEYQESKKRYERLHEYDDLRMSKSQKSKVFLNLKKQAKRMKR